MENKSILIFFLIACMAIYVIFFASFGGLSFLIPVSKPSVSYEEFSFELKYEIDGEEKCIEDSISCEYLGIKTTGEHGRKRQWKAYIKSTGEENLSILNLETHNSTDREGNQILELIFEYGSPEYYMGDYEGDYSDYAGQDFNIIVYKAKTVDGGVRYNALSAEDAYEKYGIRLISWECDPPIKNTFK